MIRAIERLRWESQNNGNGNWDEGFDRFCGFLEQTLAVTPPFDDDALGEIRADISRLSDSIIRISKMIFTTDCRTEQSSFIVTLAGPLPVSMTHFNIVRELCLNMACAGSGTEASLSDFEVLDAIRDS